MRTFHKLIVSAGLIALSLAVSFQAHALENTDLTPEKLDDIKASCVSAQVVLQKIQYNDAANRVNRGQGYESLVTRLIIPMNSRVAGNGLSSSTATLAGITTRYQQAFATFKTDYENYDDAVTSALRTKCQQKPIVFYEYLTKAREQRVKLSNDITLLAQVIEEYRQAVVKLKAGI